MHFSSVMDPSSLTLSDDLVIQLSSNEIPDYIELQRWHNHMVQFIHEIDLTELKSRSTTKKKVETRFNEILSFTITVLNEQDLKFSHKLIRSISQHYLIIDSFTLKRKSEADFSNDPGPSFFIVRTSHVEYVMPIIDGEICIKLPETL